MEGLGFPVQEFPGQRVIGHPVQGTGGHVGEKTASIAFMTFAFD